MIDLRRYLVKPDAKAKLADYATKEHGGLDENQARERLAELKLRMADLQEILYAQGEQALLVVIQAMDTGGKDSTIRSVFTGFNPAGCRVANFRAPNDIELRHDFLWRVHQRAPRMGQIVVFNRSHYEDVLIVRVQSLVPEKRWRARYKHINHFERLLSEEGTRIVKFFLHISKDYQKQRLLRRLSKPDKLWKFDPADVAERARWHEYESAYEAVFEHCSTAEAPWYIVPAETRWFRDLLVAQVLVETLEDMDLKYPRPTIDPRTIVID